MAYRKPVAERIAMCYEQKKDLSKALEWVEAACDKPPARNRWGTCEAAEAERLACWKTRLLENLGRADEALKSVEPMVIDADSLSKTSAFLLVDVYHRRRQLDRLDKKIAEGETERGSVHAGNGGAP